VKIQFLTESSRRLGCLVCTYIFQNVPILDYPILLKILTCASFSMFTLSQPLIGALEEVRNIQCQIIAFRIFDENLTSSFRFLSLLWVVSQRNSGRYKQTVVQVAKIRLLIKYLPF